MALLDYIPPERTELLGYILSTLLPLILGIFWPVFILPWLLYMGLFIYRQFISPQFLPAKGKVVYITGCDSGFGHSVALKLDSLGCYVFAGCLDTKGAGAQELRATASDRLKIMELDVTDQHKVDKCAQEIKEFCTKNNFIGLWGLYNNAGIAMAGEIEWIDIETMQLSMNINLWGAVRVTKSVLPLIRKTKGRVVTVTSGISICPQPGRSPYSVSKAALQTFMDCLRYEMHKFGVKCCIIMPGNLTSVTRVFATMADKIDKVINDMNEEIKNDYGEKYLETFRNSIASGYKGQGSFPVSVVVDAIEHAILSKYPRSIYKPAQFGWIVWWLFVGMMPTRFSDICHIYWMRKMPKPPQNVIEIK